MEQEDELEGEQPTNQWTAAQPACVIAQDQQKCQEP